MGHSRAGVRRRQKIKRRLKNERTRRGNTSARSRVVLTEFAGQTVGIRTSDSNRPIVMSQFDGIPVGIRCQ